MGSSGGGGGGGGRFEIKKSDVKKAAKLSVTPTSKNKTLGRIVEVAILPFSEHNAWTGFFSVFQVECQLMVYVGRSVR